MFESVIERIRIRDRFQQLTERARGLVKPLSVRMGVAAFIVVMGWWGCRTLWHCVTHLDMFMISPSTLSLQMPSWTQGAIEAEIRRAPGLQGRFSIFERGLTAKLAKAYESSPWVRRVHWLKKEFPNKISMSLEIRKPIGVVRQGSARYLIDGDGVRLPAEYYSLPAEQLAYPYVTTARSTLVPAPGQRWDDAAIQAGAELVQFLRRNEADTLVRITAIDVTGVGGRRRTGKSDIVLWTESGTRIRWGCPPSCGQPDELSYPHRLRNLLDVAANRNNDLSDLEYLDVRWTPPQGKLRG